MCSILIILSLQTIFLNFYHFGKGEIVSNKFLHVLLISTKSFQKAFIIYKAQFSPYDLGFKFPYHL
jgi:hypothetical protein